MNSPEGRDVGKAVSREGAMLETLAANAADPGGMWELRLEEERCWRADVGRTDASRESVNPVDVEDAVEATDAVCCLRRVNSRVRRFTYIPNSSVFSLNIIKTGNEPQPPVPSLGPSVNQRRSWVEDDAEGLVSMIEKYEYHCLSSKTMQYHRVTHLDQSQLQQGHWH